MQETIYIVGYAMYVLVQPGHLFLSIVCYVFLCVIQIETLQLSHLDESNTLKQKIEKLEQAAKASDSAHQATIRLVFSVNLFFLPPQIMIIIIAIILIIIMILWLSSTTVFEKVQEGRFVCLFCFLFLFFFCFLNQS